MEEIKSNKEYSIDNLFPNVELELGDILVLFVICDI